MLCEKTPCRNHVKYHVVIRWTDGHVDEKNVCRRHCDAILHVLDEFDQRKLATVESV